jgi:hypothetical protein
MRFFLLLAVVCFSVPAFAALAPQYYEQARTNADSVIVVRVERVSGLALGDRGTCHVVGVVAAVERGTRYQVDARVTIGVPCRRLHADVPASGVQYKEVHELRRSRWGRAFLDANGDLALYQYDILAAYP